MFPVEIIPDNSNLYMRVNHNHIQEGNPIPYAFTPHNGGTSVDWDKYSTPEETKNRVINYGKEPSNYGVVSFITRIVRSKNLEVIHNPEEDNQAHTNICGKDKNEIRLTLVKLFSWEIPYE